VAVLQNEFLILLPQPCECTAPKRNKDEERFPTVKKGKTLSALKPHQRASAVR
jgi:hypothetical protein